MKYFLLSTAILFSIFINVHLTNGLRCYNCHSKCHGSSGDPMKCHYSEIYLNSIAYNRSRDGLECPYDYQDWNLPNYIVECDQGAFCGKREISIHVKFTTNDEDSMRTEGGYSTPYPILDPNRIYHRVYGCMYPAVDCDRKKYDRVIKNINTNNETITIAGKIVEEADCRKCQNDLCNGEPPSHIDHSDEPPPHLPSSSPAKVYGSLLWILVSCWCFNIVNHYSGNHVPTLRLD